MSEAKRNMMKLPAVSGRKLESTDASRSVLAPLLIGGTSEFRYDCLSDSVDPRGPTDAPMMVWRRVWRFVIVVLVISGCTTGTEKPTMTTKLSEPTDLEKYYPIQPHRVRWYAVKDVNSGAPIDFISFAIVGQETSPDGGLVYLVENRFSSGISVDYQKVTSEQVQLERLVLLTRNGDLNDVRFAPALPMLRAPVRVGWVWTEWPRVSDQPYLYRVDSRFSMTVLGKEIQDCMRVVRTHVIVDRKTDYCPGVGIAAFEMHVGNDKWVRAELVAIAAETDLIAVKSSVRVPGGCEYVFDPLGPSQGELTVTVSPPGRSPMTFRRPANENIHVRVPADAAHGQWRVEIQQPPRTALQIFSWSGKCRADFLAPPPSLGPSLTLIREEAEQGRVTLTVAGAGWKPSEPLILTLAGPGWDTKTSPAGTANAAGVSPAVSVPFADSLPRGAFTLTMRGTSQAATLNVECRDGPSATAEPMRTAFCAVRFWRQK